jgi:uncharacterized protein with HEPN domain
MLPVKQRDYQDFLRDILDSIDKILSFTENVSFDDFRKNTMMEYSVVRCLEIIGEAAMRLPPSIKTKYPDVPWKDMVAMRNKVIHEYFGVDAEILWQTVKDDIPALRPLIKEIIKEHK